MFQESMIVKREVNKYKSAKLESIFKPSLSKPKHKSVHLLIKEIKSQLFSNQVASLMMEDLIAQMQAESNYRQQAIQKANILMKNQQKYLSNMIEIEYIDEPQIHCVADEEPPSQYRPKVIKEDQLCKQKKRPSRFRNASFMRASNTSYTSHEEQLAAQQNDVQKKQREIVLSKLKKEYLSVLKNRIIKDCIEIPFDYRPNFSQSQSLEIQQFRKNIFKAKKLTKISNVSSYNKSTLQNNPNVVVNKVSVTKNRKQHLQKIDPTMSNIFEIKQGNRAHQRHSIQHQEINIEEPVKIHESKLNERVELIKLTRQIIPNRVRGSLTEHSSFINQIQSDSKPGVKKKTSVDPIKRRQMDLSPKNNKILANLSCSQDRHLPKITKK